MSVKRISPLVLAGLLLSACVASDEEPAQTSEVSRAMDIVGSWTIERIDSKDVNAKFAPEFEFHADGLFSGSSGCNRMSSQYQLKGSDLSIAMVAGTKMMCEPAAMDAEMRVWNAMDRIASVHIDDSGRLVITDESGQRLFEGQRKR